MGRREFTVRDIAEVFIHWQTGESIRKIAKNLGMDRKTIRKYIRAAINAGYKTGEYRTRDEWIAFIKQAFPEVADRRMRRTTVAEIEAFRELIEKQLAENTVNTVWQRLRDEAGLCVSLSSFRRYINLVVPEKTALSSVTVYRPEVPPGEEAQVDWGYLGMWTDPVTGKRHKLWAFVLVLSYSRHMFVCVTQRVTGQIWINCHTRAFEFIDAVPKRIVLDNLKGGVIKPDIYDPKFNRAYAEMAAYYGTLIDPCRSGHPKDKPRVERMVPYVRDSFWRGREFTGMEQIQQASSRWCLEVAGTRIHGATRRKPLELFELEEKHCLLPLPVDPWEPVQWLSAKVAPDSHVCVHKVLYSVPWKFIGKRLEIKITPATVRFYLHGEIIKTHLRTEVRKRQTDASDLPEDKIAFFQRTPQWCLQQAELLGAPVKEAIAQLLSVNTLYRLRQAQGTIRMEKKYGAARLNAACLRACSYGDPGYRTIKNILEKGLDRFPLEAAEPDSQVPAYLHGQEQFIWPRLGRD